MKFEAVNKIYTQKVAEWIAKGYWINAGTMSGSQGEYAHIDLTNGTELIRVLLADETDWQNREFGYGALDTVVLIVGRCTDNIRLGDADRLGNTVWNNKLEVIEKMVWWKALGHRSNWLMSEEEVQAQIEKRNARHEARKNKETGKKVFKGAEKVVKSFINRQKGCKGVKASEISEVRKIVDENWRGGFTVRYEVIARGKTYRMA